MKRAVVMGLGVTGRTVAEALAGRGVAVVALDNNLRPELETWSEASGIAVTAPDAGRYGDVLADADAIFPAPGLPDHHEIFQVAAAKGIPVNSEFDLAQDWDDRRVIAVTGTDGKTTVVTMIEQMLVASGIATAAVGNTAIPLVAAIDDPSYDCFVVEASSFRLAHSARFAPEVGTWLNFSADHLDAHATLSAYEHAKASIWSRMTPNHVAIANRDDPSVMRHARAIAPAQLQTFGADDSGAHGVSADQLILSGEALMPIGQLYRQLPHDIMNALAAGASAAAAGADRVAIAQVLHTFAGLPHRVQFVTEIGGVRYIDDSKATTPHAAIAATQGFESIVLIAGGRNKGLDLGDLAKGATGVRHVVAIGDSADEVAAAFTPGVPVSIANSMEVAVDQADTIAEPGDVVLLSPACASFDWYGSYGERGDDFQRIVRNLEQLPTKAARP